MTCVDKRGCVSACEGDGRVLSISRGRCAIAPGDSGRVFYVDGRRCSTTCGRNQWAFCGRAGRYSSAFREIGDIIWCIAKPGPLVACPHMQTREMCLVGSISMVGCSSRSRYEKVLVLFVTFLHMSEGHCLRQHFRV